MFTNSVTIQGSPRSRRAAFTLVEMLVVIGIIVLVASLSVPMMTPFIRGRKLDQAADMVKSACILARSKAVQQRRAFNVTILQAERAVIITDYADLRDGVIAPAAPLPGKAAGNSNEPYCAHGLGNYGDNAAMRFAALSALAEELGQRPRVIPEGCRFEIDAANPDAAWTWVFQPNGSVMALPGTATNSRDTWCLSTYTDASGKISGPLIHGPRDEESTQVIVYAMTGQVVTE